MYLSYLIHAERAHVKRQTLNKEDLHIISYYLDTIDFT